MTSPIHLTKPEAKILFDVLSMVQNDPDWQEMASATDSEWADLERAASKISAVARD